jgi:hypothetical protein
MRICTDKSTGEILEMQSSATEGTLIQNAVNAGHVAEDVEEKVITVEQWGTLNAQSRNERDADTTRRDKARKSGGAKLIKMGLTVGEISALMGT